MAKSKKTRRQKIATTERKEQLQYSYHSTVVADTPKTIEKTSESLVGSFFKYDLSLIYRDLLKTVLISGSIIIGLLLLSTYLS